MHTNTHSWLSKISAASIVLFIFLLAISIISSRVFFGWQYEKLGLSTVEQDLAEQTRYLVVHVHDKQILAQRLSELEHPTLHLSFDQLQINHLLDVSVLLTRMQWLLVVAAVLLCFSLLLFKQKNIWLYVFTYIRNSIAVLFLVGIGLYFFWWQFFTTFHEMFFPQGNWAFPANSLLIILFPEQLWIQLFWSVASLVTLLHVAVLFFARRQMRV